MQNTFTREKDASEKAQDYATAIRQGEEKIKNVINDVENKLKVGQERVKQFVATADKQAHENPWPIVAGVALSCLFLGFIMGNAKRNG